MKGLSLGRPIKKNTSDWPNEGWEFFKLQQGSSWQHFVALIIGHGPHSKLRTRTQATAPRNRDLVIDVIYHI
jgi:hypothetical protein